MVEYTGEYWQNDILYRDLNTSQFLIDEIADRLYKEEFSSQKRKEKLLEIPEMVRLSKICTKECASINSLIRSIDPRKGNKMNDNLNTPVVDPFMDPYLTDDDLAKLLAVKPEPVDGILGYVTFDDSSVDESVPSFTKGENN